MISGSIMKWLRDTMRLIDSVSETSDMAIKAGTTGGVFIVPAFVGLGAPYWDPQAKASIVGLTFGSGKEQIVRAALESMAFQANDVLQAMTIDSEIPLSVLKVDGGAAANDFLLQFQADLCQIDVMRFKMTELTAMGAAYLAGLAVGFWGIEDLRNEVEHVFTPVRPEKEMQERYHDWKKAVKACQSFETEEFEQNHR